MPARTDHDRRDAQHWVRLTVSGTMGQFIRRVTADAYNKVEEVQAKYDGTEPIDWAKVGQEKALEALADWGIIASPERAIDADHVEAIEANTDTTGETPNA